MSHIVEHGSSQKHLLIALGLGITYLILLTVGSFIADSISLAANASHMVIHNGAILIGIIATHYATKEKQEDYSYRYNKAEALGGFTNAILLALMAAFIIYHSIAGHEGHDHSFGLLNNEHSEIHTEHDHHAHAEHPDEHKINAKLTFAFALAGFILHIISLTVLSKRRNQNLCVHGAFACIKYDVISIILSLFVGVAVLFGASHELDLIVATIIGLMLLNNARKLLIKSGMELLGVLPKSVKPQEIKETLLKIDHVKDVHNLVIQNEGFVEGKHTLRLSAHLGMSSDCIQEGHWEPCLKQAEKLVKESFGITHALFQLERFDAECHHH